MFVVVRRYKAPPQLVDALEASQAEIERLARDVRGFLEYYLVRTKDGGMSVTVCEDRAGAEESNLLAADWITEHALALSGITPEVTEGETAIHITKQG
jgi:hypothetical protein